MKELVFATPTNNTKDVLNINQNKIAIATSTSDGKYIVACIEEDGIKVLDASTFALVYEIKEGISVTSANTSPDNKWLITGGGSMMDTRLWNIQDRTASEIIVEEMFVNDVTFSNDGNHIWIVKREIVWKIERKTKRVVFSKELNNASAIKKFSADRNLLLSANENSLVVYKLTNELRKKIELKFEEKVIIGAWASDAEHIAVLFLDGTIKLINNQQVIADYKLPIEDIFYEEGHHGAFSANGKYFTLHVVDEHVIVLETTTGDVVINYPCSSSVKSLHFACNEDAIVFGEAYGRVKYIKI